LGGITKTSQPCRRMASAIFVSSPAESKLSSACKQKSRALCAWLSFVAEGGYFFDFAIY